MQKNKKKKSYKKPGIVYEKKMETLAVTCGSAWIGPTPGCCQTDGCIKPELAV